jgi:mRNA-degrading endonuclease RelE of RelBE toxin-antitoxin system
MSPTNYEVSVAATAKKDLDALPTNLFDTITQRINVLKDGIPGSVKRLSNFGYDCRLRVGNYRILFDVRGAQITIRRVLHRRHAYASPPGKKKRKGEH